MGFNEAQAQAIQHTDGPCLVLAGPGSGKTLTIVNRVKYLIEKQKVRPEEILVVTFTRFAAAEMKSRLCLVMGACVYRRAFVCRYGPTKGNRPNSLRFILP